MSLFQKSVIKNKLQSIKNIDIKEGWDNFQNYKSIVDKIKVYKEEEFQFDFLKMIFNDCLGYKISDVGDEQRNLYTEVKNVSDSKKADGAIKKDDKVIAVIELKSQRTRDFKKIQDQAFLYKASHGVECNYIITSNFEKLRFYIDSSSDFEEFNLFNLSKADFKLLYICLHKENLFSDIPKKLKDESVLVEENITKKLYKDYSNFRRELFDSLVKSNIEYDKLLLFNKTQKLLDRFLFIFFAEDRNLVPPNSISEIINKWEGDVGFGESRSLYSIFKQYFNVLNTGRPARGEHEAIFAYNGGLFADDEVLDIIEIDDNILLKHTKNLSHYDFESEISVNILGHIFENSLSEIEEIQNEISGEGKSVSKRKKDGVFYTPSYITKYIVENTLGKLCKEKLVELEFNEAEFVKDRKGRPKKTLEKLSNQLDSYREWLLEITICDPACGSGAFLVEALNFLINEHKYIDELRKSLFGESIQYSDINASILENNLYGVDINDESIEIAKLSLWLRTAEKGRKLTSLNNNIKCGNSLIDNIEIAGEKAFNWHSEFPKVFANGGFDIVIGNPPYAYRNTGGLEIKKYFNSNFKSAEGNFELYKFFMEKGISLVKEKGLFSFITSSSFLIQKSFSKLRKLILDKTNIVELYPLGPGVFEDATVDTAIFIFEKSNHTGYVTIKTPKKSSGIEVFSTKKVDIIRFYNNNGFVFDCQLSEEMYKMLDKVHAKSERLEELFEIGVGINTGYIRNILVSSEKIDERYHLMVPGSGISRYGLCNSYEWIMYDKEFVKSQGKLGRALPDKRFFDNDKLLIVRTRNLSMPVRIVATFDSEKKYNLNRLSNIIAREGNSLFGLLGFLNSSFYNWLFSTKYLDYEIKPIYLRECPIIKDGLFILEDSVKKIYNKTVELETLKDQFNNYIKSKFNLDKLSGKLQKWNELDFGDYIKEVNKAVKKSKGDIPDDKLQFSLMSLFQEQKEEAQTLKSEIDKTDKEIDQMVYELYGLSKEEIEIIESN